MQNWFFSQSGSTAVLFLKVFLILFCIILIFYGFILLLKFIQNYFLQKKHFKTRISIKEQHSLDNTRKIALITLDNQEFLLFLGLRNEFLITKSSATQSPDTISSMRDVNSLSKTYPSQFSDIVNNDTLMSAETMKKQDPFLLKE